MATPDSDSRVPIVLTVSAALALLGGVYYRAAHPGDVLITIGAERTTPQEGSPITLKVCTRSRDGKRVPKGTLTRLSAGASGRFFVPTDAACKKAEAEAEDAKTKGKDEDGQLEAQNTVRNKALDDGSPTVFLDASSKGGAGCGAGCFGPSPGCQSVWFKAEAMGPVEIVASADGGEAKLMLAVIPDDHRGEGGSNSAEASDGGAGGAGGTR